MAEEKAKKVTYGMLKQRHPEYNIEYWERCRAFYKGGPSLTEDEDLMRRVFPQHQGEKNAIYNKRKKDALYANYAGPIIDYLAASLGTDPVDVMNVPDGFYKRFLQDCTPPNGERKDIQCLVKDVVTTALQLKRAWVLVDLPDIDMSDIMSLAEQEQAGALDAWCVEIAPECVVDWEQDAAGELEWAMLCFKSSKRGSITETRGKIKETYQLYTRQRWVTWEVEYAPDNPPPDKQEIDIKTSGEHNFGRVPLVKFELESGLWAMGKLESLARNHLNKYSALSWAENKALMPILYEFHDNSLENEMIGGDGADPNRAYKQQRGSAYVQVRNSGDKVEWVAPTEGPFQHALESLGTLRDEMHRVVHQMAMAADIRGAFSQRSGLAKKMDHQVTNIVLDALGSRARDFVQSLLNMVALVRKDPKIEWAVRGMSSFDTEDLADLVEIEAFFGTSVHVPSPTFQIMRGMRLVEKYFGDTLTSEQKETIQNELEKTVNLEAELVEASYGEEDIGIETAPENDSRSVTPANREQARPNKPQSAPGYSRQRNLVNGQR